MTKIPKTPQPSHSPATLRSYVTGFVLSLMLTLVAYMFVESHVSSSPPLFSTPFLIGLILSLAMAQFIVQLIFFLHLGTETKPRWKLTVFLFMVVVVGIVVIGSLWIMKNLNDRMTPQQVNTYMNDQDGL
ncbi:MAG TPA: cytochrome o ubiquinol oxidase subunit IV [Candidatus Saccharimonadia bacterium]|nr:cytochrome o ubiquinol oxidase subunit IV [Candidatus Saccharimonadia bacterium]